MIIHTCFPESYDTLIDDVVPIIQYRQIINGISNTEIKKRSICGEGLLLPKPGIDQEWINMAILWLRFLVYGKLILFYGDIKDWFKANQTTRSHRY